MEFEYFAAEELCSKKDCRMSSAEAGGTATGATATPASPSIRLPSSDFKRSFSLRRRSTNSAEALSGTDHIGVGGFSTTEAGRCPTTDPVMDGAQENRETDDFLALVGKEKDPRRE